MTVPLRKEPEYDQGSRREEATRPRPLDAANENLNTGVQSSAAPLPIDAGRERPNSAEVAGNEAGIEHTPLFQSDEIRDMQSQWDQIQTGFVNEPRNAVREADALVGSAIRRLSEGFSGEQSKLEQQWDNGNVSTEDLRLALQRYRSFFHRVLSV